jgi:RNA polymerase sigma factor (sigma-70 family)
MHAVATNPPQDIPDQQRVESMRGDEIAAKAVCEAIYLEFAPRLIPFAYGYVRSHAHAEEIVHDVFLAVWKRRQEWAPRTGIGTYLYTAVRNRALKVIRHDAVVARHATQTTSEADPVSSPVDVGDNSALTVALTTAIASLSENLREALTLRRNHEFSFREIGCTLGISEDAARVRVARAEQALRTALTPLLHANIEP